MMNRRYPTWDYETLDFVIFNYRLTIKIRRDGDENGIPKHDDIFRVEKIYITKISEIYENEITDFLDLEGIIYYIRKLYSKGDAMKSLIFSRQPRNKLKRCGIKFII